MKIAVLTSLYPGPPKPLEGVFAERRWLGMRARGHGVRVVQPLPRAPWPLLGRYATLRAMPGVEERSGMPIERPRYLHLPRAHRSNAARFARAGLRALIAGPRPDVVVLDYAWPAAAAAQGLRSHALAVVVNGRGSDVLQVAGEAGLGDLLREGLCAASNWSAVSQDLVNAMDRLAGRPGHGMLVPNGVDLELFRPLPSAEVEAVRAEFGVDPGRKLVLVVGHLIPRKDPLLALESFRRGAPKDAQLIYVGRGPLREELVAAIGSGTKAGAPGSQDSNDTESSVRLLGELEPVALARLLAAADLLLLTSRREGRPNVVLEALACGTPVVATEAGGTAELLLGFEDRLLVRERSADAIGMRLSEVLRERPNSQELRALVQPLSWDASFVALEACLQAAIEGNSSQ